MLCSAGIGPDALLMALAKGGSKEFNPGQPVRDLYSEALPSPTAHALPEFNIRNLLGRKGTSFLDRRSAFTLVACGQALENSGIKISDDNRHRIGLALGTTWGSLKSMSDYTRETLVEERPYLVNAGLFPNTVMNCAAGQAAIWYGLKGVNATIAGGQLAFLNVLRYAANAIRGSYADIILAGAVEEFTPHSAWATHLVESRGSAVTAGEGAAIFVLHAASDPALAGFQHTAEILSVATGVSFESGSGEIAIALESSIRRALAKANVEPSEIRMVAISEGANESQDTVEAKALAGVFGDAEVRVVGVKKVLGECHSASGALQLAMLLTLHRIDPTRDGQVSLITAWTPDGGVGAAVLRGWSGVGSNRG